MGVVDKFLSLYEGETKRIYKCHLVFYFKYLNVDPDKYLTSDRDYEQDIRDFWSQQKKYTKSLCTRNSRLNAVKQFLIDNNVELSQKFWKRLKRSTKDKGNTPITIDRVPNKVQLKKILSHAKPMDRALFLLASSTGMRISEIMKLSFQDIDMDHEPPMIKIRAEYTKTGRRRIAFFSQEAKEAIQTWMDERDEWIEKTIQKTNWLHKRSSEDNRVFPICTNHGRVMWYKLIKKAGLDIRDPNTGFYEFHIHTLRKYFSTNLNAGGMPHDCVEALLGHQAGLEKVYNLYSEDQMGKLYNEYVGSLLVFSTPVDLSGVHEELKEKDMQIRNLERTMQELKAQVIEMRLERIEKENGIKKK